MRLTFREIAVGTALVGTCAFAQAQSFSGFSGFATANGGGTYIGSNTLQLTHGNSAPNGEASSAFYQNQINISGGFAVSFHYSASDFGGFGPADGFTFIIQNSAGGTSALGTGGSGLGYGYVANSSVSDPGNPLDPHIDKSAGFGFSMWQGNPTIGSQFLSGGVVDVNSYQSMAGFDISNTNGFEFDATITYDATTHMLHEQLFQGPSSFFDIFVNIDLSTELGGNLGYVGFTGSDGAGLSDQRITNLNFATTPEPFTTSLAFAGVGLYIRRRFKPKKA